jgi:hypothetical protein
MLEAGSSKKLGGGACGCRGGKCRRAGENNQIGKIADRWNFGWKGVNSCGAKASPRNRLKHAPITVRQPYVMSEPSDETGFGARD